MDFNKAKETFGYYLHVYRVPTILVASTLIVALLFGILLHATVQHEEGDHHASSGVVWDTLHSALHHEDKILALVATYLLVFANMISGMRATPLHVPIGVKNFDHKHEQLRRGTAKYRRFS